MPTSRDRAVRAEQLTRPRNDRPLNLTLHRPAQPARLGHKLNSYLAFRVGRIGGLAQEMGKLGHEAAQAPRPRLWTLPFVGASMVAIATAARLLDPILPEPDETLNFIVLARRR